MMEVLRRVQERLLEAPNGEVEEPSNATTSQFPLGLWMRFERCKHGRFGDVRTAPRGEAADGSIAMDVGSVQKPLP